MKDHIKLLVAMLCVIPVFLFFSCSDSTPPQYDPSPIQTILQRSNPTQTDVQTGPSVGSYIVSLRDSTTKTPHGLGRAIRAFKNKHRDVVVVDDLGTTVRGFSARIPHGRLNALKNDPDVEYIEEDHIASICSTSTFQTIPWGINYVGADSASTASGNHTGTVDGVEVYVVDTGIDPTHPDLNVVGGINYGNQLKDSTHWYDEHGHGTHVAGTIGARDNTSFVVGIAPGVRLYSVRVFGPLGSGASTSIIKGINWILRQRALRPSTPMVVNMSLVCTGSLSMDRAVKGLIDAGITVVVAAGNNATLASGYSPARYAPAITVGAITNVGTLATFSNFGPVVDLLAPGVTVLSTRWQGGVVNKSGTSMATPHVAGAAALYLSRNPLKSPADVASAILGATAPWGKSLPTGTTNKVLRVNTF